MTNKFTKKIAKEIADDQFVWTLDCILGYQDPDFNLDTEIEYFEQNFTEQLEERNIVATPKRVEVVNKYYQAHIEKAKKVINNLYPAKYKTKEN